MPTRSPWPCLALALATACPSTHVQPLPVAASAPAASPTAPAPPVAQLPATLAPTPGCTVEPGDILAEPIVAGSLDDAAVRHAVTQQLDRIGACVDWAVGYDLFQPGQLVVRLAVSPAGRVASVGVANDATGGDAEVHNCFERAFGDLVFPRTSTVTWVCYPINVAY
jgi:hypothetical protein